MKTNLVRFIALAFVVMNSQQGYGQNNAVSASGTQVIAVSTLNGEVVDVRVPNDIRPGDQISGSISARASSAQLEGAVIDVQNKKTEPGKKLFSFIVPAGLASLPFMIINKNGGTVCKTDLAINAHVPESNSFISLPESSTTKPTHAATGNFIPPSICIPGSPLNIPGNFDGDASNTKVMINNIPCEVIAESPRDAFLTVPPNAENGPGTLRITENGISRSYPINVASINMTSDKAVINKGQNARVNVTVKGLEQIVLDGRGYSMTVNNMSPQSVSFSKMDGNSITKELNSSVVMNGGYDFSTDIRGITSGNYTLTATLSSDWDNYREKAAMQYQDALDAGVAAQLAQQYLDFVLAAYHPGTGPGGCGITPGNSGGTLSCTNINCTTPGICMIFSFPKNGGPDDEPKEEGPTATKAKGRVYFCSCSKWQWW
jgi:hypothetical protein